MFGIYHVNQSIADRRARRKRPMALEELDRRTLLTVSPLVPAPPGLVQFQRNHASGTAVELSMLGTFAVEGRDIQLDPLGLPSFLAGDIHAPSNPSGAPVGRYEEVTHPVLVNGQLVGATGVTTFRFFANPGSGPPRARGPSRTDQIIGTITAVDTSTVIGASPTGALAIRSVGTIIQASGIFQDAQGSFTSASTLSLTPGFSLETTVQYAVAKSVDPFASSRAPGGAGGRSSAWASAIRDLATPGRALPDRPSGPAALGAAQAPSRLRRLIAHLPPPPVRVLRNLFHRLIPGQVDSISIRPVASTPVRGQPVGVPRGPGNAAASLETKDVQGLASLLARPYKNRFYLLTVARFLGGGSTMGQT